MALEPITRQEQIIAGKDLEPITRMEKFLKKYGGSGGSGGGVSPEEVTTIVKEQFPGGVGYSEVTEAVILPETSYSLHSYNGMRICTVYNATLPFSVGGKYKVVWNGIEYICICAEASGHPYVGDVSAMVGGTSTGEPFAIMVNETDNVVSITSWVGDTEATVSIYELAETPVPIDPKYLPNTGGDKFIVTFSTADMQNWTCDKTLAEITEAINGGKEVVGSVMEVGVDFLCQMPNGSVTFGRVFPDGGRLQSYHIGVFEDGVTVTMAYIEMTVMGGK